MQLNTTGIAMSGFKQLIEQDSREVFVSEGSATHLDHLVISSSGLIMKYREYTFESSEPRPAKQLELGFRIARRNVQPETEQIHLLNIDKWSAYKILMRAYMKYGLVVKDYISFDGTLDKKVTPDLFPQVRLQTKRLYIQGGESFEMFFWTSFRNSLEYNIDEIIINCTPPVMQVLQDPIVKVCSHLVLRKPDYDYDNGLVGLKLTELKNRKVTVETNSNSNEEDNPIDFKIEDLVRMWLAKKPPIGTCYTISTISKSHLHYLLDIFRNKFAMMDCSIHGLPLDFREFNNYTHCVSITMDGESELVVGRSENHLYKDDDKQVVLKLEVMTLGSTSKKIEWRNPGIAPIIVEDPNSTDEVVADDNDIRTNDPSSCCSVM